MSTHYFYLAKCADNTLYSGYTTDLERREREHNTEPKGAKYTAARRPVRIVYSESFATRSAAQKREWQVKQMSKQQKFALLKQ